MINEETQGFKELQPGTTLNGGKYIIEKKIGEGGFGITYKAVQRGLNRTVCIKEYFPAGKCVRNTRAKTVHLQGISEAMFEKYRQAFVKEAQTLATLHHPNIVEVIDVFDENNTSYMVMPFIEGESLQYIVDKLGNLSYPEAVNYLAQITNAVGYIHERHILHRDIKPDNIMITADHKAILIDFGSAREFEHDKTQMHTSMLTHGYAPTEQYTSNSRKGSYTDIYALGATFYFAITGKVPVEAAARLTEKMPEPKELSPSIPDEANRTILKAMQIRPENRHQSIQEFIDDLRNKRPSSLIDETIGGTKNKIPKRWISMLIIGITLLIIGASVISIRNAKHQRQTNEYNRLMNEMINGLVEELHINYNGSNIYLMPTNGMHAQGYYYLIKDGNPVGIKSKPSGRHFLYSGQMKDGYPHGEGKAIYDDETKYFGIFNKGFKHGKGKLIFPGGEIYEGDYENDVASGQGKMTYTDGSVYEGRWKNNMQNGYGRFLDKNGQEIMKGIFEDGNLTNSR